MKLSSLRSWFGTKPTADQRPLTAAEIAVKLTAAKVDLKGVDARVEQARLALAADRSEQAMAALRATKAEADDLNEMLRIVQQDHDQAVAREAAAERSAKEQRIAQLAQQLTDEAVTRAGAELARREGDLLHAVAKVRAQRQELRLELEELAREHRSLRLELGADPAKTHLSHAPALAVAPRPVLRALDAVTLPLEPSSPLRNALVELRPTGDTYADVGPRGFTSVDDEDAWNRRPMPPRLSGQEDVRRGQTRTEQERSN
jgi:hypothetical protein